MNLESRCVGSRDASGVEMRRELRFVGSWDSSGVEIRRELRCVVRWDASWVEMRCELRCVVSWDASWVEMRWELRCVKSWYQGLVRSPMDSARDLGVDRRIWNDVTHGAWNWRCRLILHCQRSEAIKLGGGGACVGLQGLPAKIPTWQPDKTGRGRERESERDVRERCTEAFSRYRYVQLVKSFTLGLSIHGLDLNREANWMWGTSLHAATCS